MLEASKPGDPKAITSLQSGENGISFGIKIFCCLYVRICLSWAHFTCQIPRVNLTCRYPARFCFINLCLSEAKVTFFVFLV